MDCDGNPHYDTCARCLQYESMWDSYEDEGTEEE
jgi:hypothetical protein